jgi:hypothetical protein
MASGRLDLVRGGQRHSRESWKTTPDSQETQYKNWHSDSLKKVQLTLSQAKKKNGDDAARISMSQDGVTATLCTKESFLSPQYK